jgi:hypothetical protein
VKPPPDGPPGGGLPTETAPTAPEDGDVKTRYEAIPVTVEQ